MPDETIPFACTSCRAVNKVSLPDLKEKLSKKVRIILICGSCGRVNMGQKIEKSKDPKHNNQNYCACLPFDGPEKDIPTGYVEVGGRTLWKDANGKAWTTEEFITKYGIHPGIAWRNILLQRKAFEQAIQMGRPQVAAYKIP